MAWTLLLHIPLAECLLHVGSHRAFCDEEAELVISLLRWQECYRGVHPMALE